MEKWFRMIALSLSVLLLFLLCVVAFLAARLEWSMLSISSEMKQAIGFVADTKEKVSEIGTEVNMLKGMLGSMADPQEIADEVGAAAQAGASSGANTALDARAQEEIDYLLDCIGQPEYRYEYEGKSRTSGWVRMKLSCKFAAYRSAVRSAEDFITSVATATHTGAAYYIVLTGEDKKPLGPWLRETLDRYRAASQSSGKE